MTAVTGLSSDVAGGSVIAFVVADGALETQGLGLPVPGNAQAAGAAGGTSPMYPAGAVSAIGAAERLRSAEVIITDGAAATFPTGTVAAALRAAIGPAGITPNRNVIVKIALPGLVVRAATPTVAAPKLTDGTTLLKGILKLVWD